jgi:hypothetical protein
LLTHRHRETVDVRLSLKAVEHGISADLLVEHACDRVNQARRAVDLDTLIREWSKGKIHGTHRGVQHAPRRRAAIPHSQKEMFTERGCMPHNESLGFVA